MQVGKTTCADYLVERHGYARYALADPIKEVARSYFGWDGAKDERGRRLLQQIGSTGRAYDPALWLKRFDAWLAGRNAREETPGSRGDRDAALATLRAERGPVVVDDLRLLAEAEHLRRRGFHVVLVQRPGRAATEDSLSRHETETELAHADPDLVIVNDGTIGDLHAKLEDALARLG